jgi:hypothetical protein
MKLVSAYTPSQPTIRNWFLIILAVKLCWLVLFTTLRGSEVEASRAVGMALIAKDTPMYYESLESLYQNGVYSGLCRMPGLMPFYIPLRVLFSPEISKQGIILFQVLADAIATLLLCLIAARIYDSSRAFKLTALLLCLSTFVSIRSSYLLSDSFGISACIIATYFLVQFADLRNLKNAFWCGVFICWAIFLRQITVLLIPVCTGIMLFAVNFQWRVWFKACIVFMLPIVIAISAWAIRNQITYHRTVFLVAPVEECMTQLTPAYSSIRKFVIVTGKDFQPWSVGDAAHWFVQPDIQRKMTIPYEASEYTSAYNADSLLALKSDYHNILALEQGTASYDSLEQRIISKTARYSAAYKHEHTVRFYVANRFAFLFKFLFPWRIDDLPFPAMNEMNVIQKGIKAWSLVFLWSISALSLLALVFHAFRKDWGILLWAGIPWSLTAALSVLGFIEQRFLATSYPFMVMMVAGLLAIVAERYWKKETSVQPR